jgi:hypothetical protein
MSDTPTPPRIRAAIAAGMVAVERARAEGGTAAALDDAYRRAVDAHLPAAAPSTVVAPCPRDTCRCTHTAPCDRGWVELPPRTVHGHYYQRVTPCPMCRPEAHDRYARSVIYGSRTAKGV